MNRWKRRRGGEIGRISGSARHAYRLVSRNPTVACKTVSNRRHDDLRTRTALTARTGLHRSSDCHCEGRRQGGRRCVHAPVFSAAKPKPDTFDSVLFLFRAQHARPESGCRCTAVSKNASNAARAIFRRTAPLRRAPRAFQGAAEIHGQIASGVRDGERAHATVRCARTLGRVSHRGCTYVCVHAPECARACLRRGCYTMCTIRRRYSSPADGMANCTLCAPGSYSDSEASTACTKVLVDYEVEGSRGGTHSWDSACLPHGSARA